jgi:dynein heavy chain
MKDGVLSGPDVGVFLKAGAATDDKNKKFTWLDQKTWNNLVALTKHKFGAHQIIFFKSLIESLTRNDKDWRAFYESDTPETNFIPDYADKLSDEADGPFLHLCLIRCLREDRT